MQSLQLIKLETIKIRKKQKYMTAIAKFGIHQFISSLCLRLSGGIKMAG